MTPRRIIIIFIAVSFSPLLFTNIFPAQRDNIRDKLKSLEGITPYGLEIKDQIKIIKRKELTVEIIYSSRLSDDIMGKYMKRFYNELIGQVEKWAYSNKDKDISLKLTISNCRFGKIGYCRKKGKDRVTLILNNNKMKDRTFSIDRIDILNKNKYSLIAKKAVQKLFSNI